MLADVFAVSAQAGRRLQLDPSGPGGFVEYADTTINKRQPGSLAKKIGVEDFGVKI